MSNDKINFSENGWGKQGWGQFPWGGLESPKSPSTKGSVRLLRPVRLPRVYIPPRS